MPLRVPAQPTFADPKLNRFAEQVIAALKQARDDIVNAVSGAVGTPLSPAVYYGYSTDAILLNELTWTDLHNELGTIVDVIQRDITRTNSTFTFSRAGLYVFDVRVATYNSAGNDFAQLRARREATTLLAGGPETFMEANAPRAAIVQLMGSVILDAGDAVTVQSACTGAMETFTPSAIDGEPGRSATFAIYRVGPADG